jgi:hypothetical protein
MHGERIKKNAYLIYIRNFRRSQYFFLSLTSFYLLIVGAEGYCIQ